jgi:hypothetical protein
VLGVSDAPAKRGSQAQAVVFAGLAVMAAALVWWVIYYAQWHGMFDLLDAKLVCLTGDSTDCTHFQDFIGPSAVPAYSPILLWAGVVVTLLGLYLTRRNKA